MRTGAHFARKRYAIHRIYQARATVYSHVNLPIFQLTAQPCAEMVPLLLCQHGRTGRYAFTGAAKTAKAEIGGGLSLQSLLQASHKLARLGSARSDVVA
jgi:hypothetical protein